MPKYRENELDTITMAYQAGRELIDVGLLEDAIPYFDRVLGRLPRRRRDMVYRIEGTAIPDEKVAWLPPVFRDALLAKVYCLNELGRFRAAYSLLKRGVELDPDNPKMFAEIGFAYGAMDDLVSAREAYERAQTLEPRNTAHLCALAHLALLDKQFAAAQTLAQQALEIEPESVTALQQLAFACYRQGATERAIRVLERAVALAPSDRESVLRLVGTLREVGRIRPAIEYLETFLQLDDTDPEANGLMTDLLQQDGLAPQLFPHAQRLLARNPRDPNALDLLAWGHFQHGQTKEALTCLRRLVLLEPMGPHHHFKLGMLYETIGNLPQGMASLLRANALDTDGEIGKMALEAVSNLDQVQIEQLLVRAEKDAHFRYRLQSDPERTLVQAGYLLSPFGFHLLQSYDLTRDNGMGQEARPRTIH